MKKKIVKKEIKREIKREYKPLPEVIKQLEKWLDAPPNTLPPDNLIYEIPNVNKQQKKETEKL